MIFLSTPRTLTLTEYVFHPHRPNDTNLPRIPIPSISPRRADLVRLDLCGFQHTHPLHRRETVMLDEAEAGQG